MISPSRKEIIAALEQVFRKGQLDITPLKITNCGLRHSQLKDGDSMGQTEDLAALKPIIHA